MIGLRISKGTFIGAVFLVVVFAFPIIVPRSEPLSQVGNLLVSGIVLADDDDDDRDDDDDDDDDDRDDDDEERETKKKSKETISVTRYEVRQVTQVLTVLAPEYRTDTDGDLLVDGIDPDPLVHQREYFTDDDDDGVPNMFDRHRGDDDFAYIEESDIDQNGILDAYERLAER